MNGDVFTAQDVAVVWGYSDERKLYELIKHYVNRGEIYRLTKGLYSFNNYTKKDLESDSNLLFQVANKLMRNSYISLFTALEIHGVVFQYHGSIYSMADKSVEKVVKGVRFIYKKIKQGVLLSDEGVIEKDLVRIAGIERAVCDTLYSFPKLELENVNGVVKSGVVKIASIYDNKALLKRVKKLAEK